MIAWGAEGSGTVVIRVTPSSLLEFKGWINDEYADLGSEDGRQMQAPQDFLGATLRERGQL